jgi:dolichyl-phosphate-mannose-protein mannosyltransferase
MKLLRRYPELIILIVLALTTRLWGVFTPVAVVFDEVYFKVYAGDYLTGSYYFDPHPPLGKLLLGAWAWLTHMSATQLTGTGPAVTLRVLPALAGALIIPVFYIMLRQLGASKRVSTLGAALLLLDNALLVESRFILIDSLLILFGMSAVTAFFAARHNTCRTRLTLLILSAVLAGLAVSTKWTGLTALGLIGVVWLYDELKQRRVPHRWLLVREAIILGAVPVLIYMSVFWVHFQLLPKTGQGDAFMPADFRASLIGNEVYDPHQHMSFIMKFLELNVEMKQSEDSLKTATHPYGSRWTSWPLMTRSVYYWQGETKPDGSQGNIYLLGNPLVWWGLLVVIAGCVLASGKALVRVKPYSTALIILATGYAINYLPFSQIVRVMFLYHYFFALLYSLAFAVILLGSVSGWMVDGEHPWQFSTPASKAWYFSILGAALLSFLYFSPLTYGWALSPAGLAQHMWLPTWR